MAKNLQAFTARVHKIDINPCVDVPARVSRFFGKPGYVPVKGTVNGFPIRATLVPIGQRRHRLYINGKMRKGAGADDGDRIRVVLAYDPEPRLLPTPKELADALQKTKRARVGWEKLRPSDRRGILSYLNWLKRPETRQRNVEQIIAALVAGKRVTRG